MLWLGDTLLRGRERDRSWQPSAAWIGRDWQRRRRTKFPQRRCGDRFHCVLHKSLAAGCLKLGDRYDAVPVGVDLSEVYDVRRGVSLSQRVAAWHRLLSIPLGIVRRPEQRKGGRKTWCLDCSESPGRGHIRRQRAVRWWSTVGPHFASSYAKCGFAIANCRPSQSAITHIAPGGVWCVKPDRIARETDCSDGRRLIQDRPGPRAGWPREALGIKHVG